MVTVSKSYALCSWIGGGNRHPPPTDNTLLWDTLRVLTRLVGHLTQALGRRLQAFHNHTRAARRRMRAIQRLTPTQRHQQQTQIYRQLIALTEQVVASARRVLQQTEKARGKDLQGATPSSAPCDPRSAATASWESA